MFVTMENNGTMHGMQISRGAARRFEPTTYYSELGGGVSVLCHPARLAGRPMRVALLGMGVGTMAYYGRTGDVYRFFEINPNVISFAQDPKYFTFLSKSLARIEVKEGDARKLLEEESRSGEAKYDLIVVDVFSGDSIPVHLATVEAMRLYLDRLAPGGMVAMHLTNWHLDLLPVVKSLAESVGLKLRAVKGTTSVDEVDFLWAYLSREDPPLRLKRDVQQEVDISRVASGRLLTDDHHSLVGHLTSTPMTNLVFLPSGE